MSRKNEMKDLRKDVSYLKHQIARIMESMEITPCVCADCVTAPKLPRIQSAEKNFDGFQIDSSLKNTLPSPNTDGMPVLGRVGASTPDEPVNLFDDVLHVNKDSSSISPNDLDENQGNSNLLNHNNNDESLKEIPETIPSVKKKKPPSKPLKQNSRKRKTPPSANVEETSILPFIDKWGRKIFSDDQKKAIYEMYSAKGWNATAKHYRVSVRVIYCLINKYKTKMQKEKLKLSKRPEIAASEPSPKLTKVLPAIVKEEIVENPEENKDIVGGNQEEKQLVVEENGRNVDVKLEDKNEDEDDSFIKKTHRYTPGMKKTIYNYYLVHGRNQTMDRFKLSRGAFMYLAYARENLHVRTNVKDTWRKKKSKQQQKSKNKNNNNKHQEKTMTDTEDDEKTLEKFKKPLQNGCETTTHNNQKDKEKIESLAKNSSGEENDHRAGSRQRILSDEQEFQLFQVLKTLEKHGTSLTPSLLSYATKQIIKRSSEDADTPTNAPDVHISYSWAMNIMKKYREQQN